MRDYKLTDLGNGRIFVAVHEEPVDKTNANVKISGATTTIDFGLSEKSVAIYGIK